MENSFKERMVHELKRFFVYAVFIALFFCSLATYRRLVLGEFQINSYFDYGYCIVEALILSKIILLGQSFHLGEKYEDKPLIIPTLYKALIFSFFALIITFAEHFIAGFIHGHTFVESYNKLLSKGLDLDLSQTLVIFLVFILFFAFLELERVLGDNKLFYLFFKRNRG